VIRERALRTGAVVVPDDRLEEYMRSEADDVVRNAGLEMLKMRGTRGLPLAISLLKDDDTDVVLQAVLFLGHLRDLRALEPLRGVLNSADPNVVQAAIEAVGMLGDARAIPDLLPYLESDPWLQMATIQALGDLRSAAAIAPLSRYLTDFTVGPLAAESLARVGGPRVFRILSQHWLRFKDELDPGSAMGWLAHVAEGLARKPHTVPDLRESLAPFLEDDDVDARGVAARSLLALGPGPEDVRCLTILADGPSDHSVLPACLSRRRDLIPHLLKQSGKNLCWGFLLAARFPKAAPTRGLQAAISGDIPLPESLRPLVKALTRVRSPEIVSALVDLYLRLDMEYRRALAPLLVTHQSRLRSLLKKRKDLDAEALFVLRVHLQSPTSEDTEELLAFDHEAQYRVLCQIADEERIVKELPWSTWLQEDPQRYGPLCSKVAADFGLTELLPHLRELMARDPDPHLVRAVGELRDQDSVPVLISLVDSSSPRLRPLIFESLGRIGGPEARLALRQAIAQDSCDPRIAYRALSLCAIEEDDAIFRQAVGHSDWYVRLACAEVLGRFLRPENLAALSQLAADPAAIVSQRALSFLEV
jgi:HEAT repeat protein